MILARPRLPASRLGGAAFVIVNAPRSLDRSPLDPAPLLLQPIEAALPRALIAPEAIVLPGPAAVAAAVDPARDPRRTAVLEEGEPLDAPRSTGPTGSVRVVAKSRSRIDQIGRAHV